MTDPKDSTVPANRKCLNCASPLGNRNHIPDRFCANCGQQDKPVKRFFLDLISEALDGVFAFNSRTWRTLIALFFKPGYLSNEYLSGRRVAYLPPIRLFLVFSLAFFLLLSLELFVNSLSSDFSSPYSRGGLQLLPDGTVVTSTGEIAAISQADFVGPRRFPALQNFNVIDEDGESQSLPELVDRVIDQFELPFVSVVNNENLRQYLQAQARTNLIEIISEPMEFVEQLLEYLPIMILVFIPLLALVLKIIYLGSGRYYVEHLVLTIHNQSFLFFALIVSALLGYLSTALPILTGLVGSLDSILSIWIVAYFLISFKRFYRQSWLLTTVRFLLVSLLYLVIILAGLLLFLIVEFFIY